MRSFFSILYFFIAISFVPDIYSQGLNVDSLKLLLSNEQNDSVKVIRFTDVSWEYCSTHFDSALLYAERGVVLANSIGNLPSQSKAFSQRAMVFYYMGDIDLAIEDYISVLKVDEVLKDSNGIRIDLMSLGNSYAIINKYDLALDYFNKAYKLSLTLNNRKGTSNVLSNMGMLHIEKEEYDEGRRNLLEALSYIEDESEKGEIYQNLGVVYMLEENYEKSAEYYKLALLIYEEASNEFNIANISVTIASNLFLSSNSEEAEYYADNALRMAKKIGSKDVIQKACFNLSRIHASLNNFEKAYEFRTQYSAYHDSIFNEKSDRAIAEMETKYQTEKTEKENEILSQKNAIQDLENENQKNEIAKQNTIIISTIVGLLFLIGLAGLLVRSVRIKKAANVQINLQKDEIEEQRDEITEINSELMASIEYAKNLQDAIIPKAAEIAKGIASHFVFWLPRDIVSGDFYWYHKDGKDVYIAAADCTGHGVPGAFVSMACHNVLNQVVIDRHYSDPGVILQQVNNGIQKVFKKEGAIAQAHDGMDIAFTKIDIENNKVIFAGALNPLLVVRGEEIIELKPDRKPIGGSAEVDSLYTEHVLELEKGDWLYMSSDGYQDQFGGVKGKKYKGKTFRKFLQEIAISAPEIQKEKLGEEFTRWKGDFEQIDDVLVVGFNLDS